MVVDAEVVLECGLVAEVRPARSSVPDRIIAPGFVDLQVNGIGSVDVAGASGSDWTVLDAALLAQGVTTWCPTITSAPLGELEAALGRIGQARHRLHGGPRPAIAGAHLEGPFITVPGAHTPGMLQTKVNLPWLEEVASELAVLTIAPELPGAMEAIHSLAGRGVVVSLGHSACSAEQAASAAAAGARMVTHLGNAMGMLHQRAPGLMGAALCDDRLAVSLISDLHHLHPALIGLAFRAKGFPGGPGVALVTDAVALEARQAGHIRLEAPANPKAPAVPEGPAVPEAPTVPDPDRTGSSRRPLAPARPADGTPARLADGTLAGSTVTMDASVRLAVRHCGVTFEQALRSAASVPATLLGLQDRGVIACGQRADLVALDPDLRVKEVWVGGEQAWPPTARR